MFGTASWRLVAPDLYMTRECTITVAWYVVVDPQLQSPHLSVRIELPCPTSAYVEIWETHKPS